MDTPRTLTYTHASSRVQVPHSRELGPAASDKSSRVAVRRVRQPERIEPGARALPTAQYVSCIRAHSVCFASACERVRTCIVNWSCTGLPDSAAKQLPCFHWTSSRVLSRAIA